MKILCQLQCTNKEKKVYSYNEISETEIKTNRNTIVDYYHNAFRVKTFSQNILDIMFKMNHNIRISYFNPNY